MKNIKKYLIPLLIFTALLSISKPLHAIWWVETSSSDWNNGYFYRSTATTYDLRISSWLNWYHPSWKYRVTITIDNLSNASNLVDYQITFTTNTKRMFDEIKLDALGTTVRFTDSDGITLIPHWNENWNIWSSTGTKFWVKIPNIPANSRKDIFMYYDDAVSTTSLSIRSQVFDLYEDWESGAINAPWAVGGDAPFRIASSTSIAEDRVYDGNFSVCNSTININQNSYLRRDFSFGQNVQIRIKFQWSTYSYGSAVVPPYTNASNLNFQFPEGSIQNYLYGNRAWEEREYFSSLGTSFAFRWNFFRTDKGISGPERGWVDKIIVRKYTTPEPSVAPSVTEESKTDYYTFAEYYSDVVTTLGENTDVIITSWTYSGSVDVYVRARNEIFGIIESTPAWVQLSFSGDNPAALGKYLQYKIVFTGPGNNTPVLNDISIQYNSPPARPTEFFGTAISTFAIMWQWKDNASAFISTNSYVYRIYSSSREYPSGGYLTNATTSVGLITELTGEVTYWIETGLIANRAYSRFVVAANEVGGNAGTRMDSLLLATTKYTQAVPPAVNAEYFIDEITDPAKSAESVPWYVKATTGIYYQDKYLRSYSSHTVIPTGNFTSNVSSGPGKVEYYHIWWGTSSTHIWASSSAASPDEIVWGSGGSYQLNTSTYADLGVGGSIPSGTVLIKKPDILLPATLNRDDWYFHCASFNGDNEISTSVVLGPFLFNGSPAPITDIDAAPSITREGEVKLTWTAPTADATLNNVTSGRIKIKYSNTLILNDTVYEASPGVTITTGSIPAGTRLTWNLTGLNPGQPYCFAIKTEDSSQNTSEFTVYAVTAAAKVSKLVVTSVAPQTFYASRDHSSYAAITLQAQDINNNPLMLDQDSVVYLYTDSIKGYFSKDLIDWTPSPGSIQIFRGENQKQFYYSDESAGTPSITCDETPSFNWSVGLASVTVIPGLATGFRITHSGSARIQLDSVLGTVEAIDEFGNRANSYLGNIISTATPGEQRMNPSTNTFTSEDLGLKNIVLSNNYIAGPAYARVEEVTDENLKDVCFFNANTGWAVGDKGTIKKTGNGGTSWISQVYGTTTARGFSGVYISPVTQSIALAVGKGGLISRTTDAGMSWQEQASGTTEDLNAIFMIDSNIGFIAGKNGTLKKTINGGTSWINSNTGISGTPELTSLYIIGSSSVGWVTGKGGVIYKTTDNGANWVDSSALLPSLGVKDLNAIRFMDSDTNIGFTVGSSGSIYKTVDAGANWSAQASSTTVTLYDIDFNDLNTGLAAGANGVILKTANAGANWSVYSSSKTFYAADFTNAGFALGAEGYILKTEDQGGSWTKFAMSGVSDPLYWNGTVLTPVSATTRPIIQGKQNQDICLFAVRTMYGGQASWTNMTIQKTGTATDDAVAAVKLYRDNGDRVFNKNSDTFKGQGSFTSGAVNLTFSAETVTETTGYYYIVYDVSYTAKVGDSLGLTIPQDAFTIIPGGIPFARNNLPNVFAPATIVQSSTTVLLTYNDLSSDYALGGVSSESVKQGAKDVPMLSFTMRTDAFGTQTNWRSIKIIRTGLNTVDDDISRINIYHDDIRSDYLIGTGTFAASNALISIDTQTITNTSKLFYVTVDVSPNSKYSSLTQNATLGLSLLSTTDYIKLINLLGEEGSDGISPSGDTVASSQIKINQARNTVTCEQVSLAVPEIYQSETKPFLEFKVSIDSNTTPWQQLKVDRTGDSEDSDVAAISVYRDADNNASFDIRIDTFMGTGVFINGSAVINFSNTEVISKSLPEYQLYYVTLTMSKRAAINKELSIRVADNTSVKLGNDVDKVATGNFPIVSSTATIKDFPDTINPVMNEIPMLDARIDEINVGVLKMQLTAYCDAFWQSIRMSHLGTSDYNAVKQIKICKDTNGNGKFDSATDLVISTGVYDSLGNALIQFPDSSNFDTTDRNLLRYTSSTLIVDATQAFFIVYDLNADANPDRTLGLGVAYTGFSYNLPNSGYNFGFKTTKTFPLLDKRTPLVPVITLFIDNPMPQEIEGNTRYYMNTQYGFSFNWYSLVNTGVADIGEFRYGISSYNLTSSTDTPDVIDWRSITTQNVDFSNINLEHNKVYYLWVEAINASNTTFKRRKSIEFKIDVTVPPSPEAPTSNIRHAALEVSDASMYTSYLVAWSSVTDLESGLLYFELQKRLDTSPIWVTISSSIAPAQNIYQITDSEDGRFYYYRVRAQNFTGSWGSYSDASQSIYLSLPEDNISQIANYPNPFDSRYKNTTITYVLKNDYEVTIRIFDLFGNIIKTAKYPRFANPGGIQGVNNIFWDGTNDNGEKVAQGMYIMMVEVKTENKSIRKNWKIGVIH